jgi:hypothetical protein
MGQGLIAAGTSMSGRTSDTTIPIETELTAQNLLDHFGQQLEEQGWSADSGWSGVVSLGSSWSASPADDVQLVGLLEIVSLEESGYQASFRATQIN